MFLFLKLFIFIYDFFAKVTCVFLASETAKKFSEWKTEQKNYKILLWFQKYRCELSLTPFVMKGHL